LNTSNTILKNFDPTAIGCIGGSGSRVVCRLLAAQDFYMGDCLNTSEDNLWFSYVFKRKQSINLSELDFKFLLELFITKMRNNNFSQIQVEIINEIFDCEHMLSSQEAHDAYHSLNQPITDKVRQKNWGWKEPNTHLVADKINKILPDFKFIYLMRNCLDMAYSENQNQPMLWGEHFLGMPYDNTPSYSLKYWIKTHQRMLELKKSMKDRMYFMDFEKLCESPHDQIIKLNHFLGVETNEKQLDNIAKLIKSPKSIGRYKNHCLDDFDEEDLDYARKLGHLE
jgi:hypothetical protein